MASWLQIEDFTPYVDGTFRAFLPEGGEPVPLELGSVHPGEERTDPDVRARPFRLIFRGPAQRALRPGTYEIAWPDALRSRPFFLQIVVGSGPGGAIYEAVFN